MALCCHWLESSLPHAAGAHGCQVYIAFNVRLTPIWAYIENYVRITGTFDDVQSADERKPALRTCRNLNKRPQNQITAGGGVKKRMRAYGTGAASRLPRQRMGGFFLPLPPR
jgi:hypothetical protein